MLPHAFTKSLAAVLLALCCVLGPAAPASPRTVRTSGNLHPLWERP